MKKPKIIIQQNFKNKHHLLIRVDTKSQVRYIIKYFRRFLKNSSKLSNVNANFLNIQQFNIPTFFSDQIASSGIVIDYLICDEGKGKSTFIFLNITCPTKSFKKVVGYSDTDYFDV